MFGFLRRKKPEEKIRELDLGFALSKLTDPNGTLCWSRERAEMAIEEYRAFLTRNVPSNRGPQRLTRDADEVWHIHILNTARYRHDCYDIFGYFLDHVPGSSDRKLATCESPASRDLATCGESPAAITATCESPVPVLSTCESPYPPLPLDLMAARGW